MHDGPLDEMQTRTASAERQPSRRDAPAAPVDDEASRKRRDAQLRQARAKQVAPLQREADKLEKEVGRMEGAVAELARRLADPAVYEQADLVRDLTTAHGRAKDRAADLLAQWEAAMEKVEAAEQRVQQAHGVPS